MQILFLLLSLALSEAPINRAWPGFLGQGATALDPDSIPLNWSPEQNVAWSTKLTGKGQSSPIIWGDAVFVTSIEGSMKDRCHITSLALSDGHVIWSKSFPASQTVRSNYFQSRSASTPTADSERIYAFFETGNLIALTHSGDVVWQRSITEDYGLIESNIGLAASLLLIDDTIIVLVDHEGPSYLLAVEAKTGKTKWKTDRDSRKSYSSPTVVNVATSRHIVCSSDGSVDGYDPATGKQLWTFSEVGGNTSSTPLQFSQGHFLVGASPGMHNEREQAARQSNFCMSIEATQDGFQPKVKWRTEKAMPSFGSPVVFRDHAYWVSAQGVVFCFDAKTGEQRYAQRTKQPMWVTPVGIGDRLYLFGKDGLTSVIASGPEFKVLSENQLWDPENTGGDPITRGRNRSQQESAHGEAVQKHKTEANQPATPPAATKEERRPPLSSKEREEARARGENRFADPVQYGVAIVNGHIVIRTGEFVYCVRTSHPNP